MPHRDPAVKRAYLQAYRIRHADRLREQRRIYNKSHRAENHARWLAWCEANPERRRVITTRARQRWEANHPNLVLNKNAKRRALLMAVTVEAVDRLVVYARDKGRCGICGRFVAKRAFDLDHVQPLSRGGPHSYLNVQVTHAVCNRRKRAVYEEVA